MYDKKNRMSMPDYLTDSNGVPVLPKRRCQSGADFVANDVMMDASVES